jgi:hypothetical protein
MSALEQGTGVESVSVATLLASVHRQTAPLGRAKQAGVLYGSFALRIGTVQTLHMEVVQYPPGAVCFAQ